MVNTYVRGVARAAAPRVEVDEFRLYRFWGWLPPESGLWRRFLAWLLGRRQQLLYVGQTRQWPPLLRAVQHAVEKDWAPDVASWELDPRIWRTQDAIDAAEKTTIIQERPVHNVAHNGNNPRAVTRTRRRLPRHVAVRRLRLAARAGLFAILWVATAVWLAASQGLAGDDACWLATVVASLAVAVTLRTRRR